ncbi:ATP-binding protein [Hydrogenovibrio sp. 3SP14C1]|uniref:ATP-binding protein n=1 Tax=Hydrogenovibrio sp. 3SP14C1 TaxID=3038774 RepID=UPI002415C3A1|nr:ATP-binding protein [Hydrogenovibrio sp. 3SP14C1]MDG4812737.1 ATP-binding protein [Hydrogenovibrio sp. 3SP14C1]
MRKPAFRLRLSIRTRFFILLLLLTILPFLAYKFAVDLHRLLLKNQAIIQQQTVVNLSYILENRTDLWALQIQAGNPTSQLSHLNLEKSVLWIVNEYGQATYVVGHLPNYNSLEKNNDPFSLLGHFLIKTFSAIVPYTLPYPYPQSKTPEIALIRQAINGRTFQQYRMDRNNQPVSLMSATPLRVKNQIIGAAVLEQTMDSLLTESLNYFYRLIGIGGLVFFLVILGAIIYTASLSNRIVRLDKDVRNTFDNYGKVNQLSFPDTRIRGYHDELSDLRHHIYEMLTQLSSYERYLKQLPRTLRHEIHNPLNRLSMSLSLLEKDVEHKQIRYSKHALEQLKQIIASLSEASSIEDSLNSQSPEPFDIGEMLKHYLESIQETNDKKDVLVDYKLKPQTYILGDGFMLEQLMDKLISNAKDFNDHQMPINILATQDDKTITIKVQNSGPALPSGYEKQIFDGMMSIREANADDQTHLGLGLFIVKLIADFHLGAVDAQNLINSQDNEPYGVEFKLELPIYQLTH